MALGAWALGRVTRAMSRSCRRMRSSSRVSNGTVRYASPRPGPKRRVGVGRGERLPALGILVVQRDDLELVGEPFDRLDPARDVIVRQADDADPEPGEPHLPRDRPCVACQPATAVPGRNARVARIVARIAGMAWRRASWSSPSRQIGVSRFGQHAGTSANRPSIQAYGSALDPWIADSLAGHEAGKGRVIVRGVERRGTPDGREQVGPPDRLLDRPEDGVASWLRRRHGRLRLADAPQLHAAARFARPVGLRLLPVFGRRRDRPDDHRASHAVHLHAMRS